MRGKGSLSCVYNQGSGITPAYAGKRDCRASGCRAPWDHPRLCGEKSLVCKYRSRALGSPPPMRGKVSRKFFRKMLTRITPAYAGKSCQPATTGKRRQDHPRLCGEKPDIIRGIMTSIGSPPPMRGKVLDSEVSLRCYGITPAYAGKRYNFINQLRRCWDHPRLCGEKLKKFKSELTSPGSPPPMRGKVLPS